MDADTLMTIVSAVSIAESSGVNADIARIVMQMRTNAIVVISRHMNKGYRI